jgi:hypothetical protein
MVNLTEDKDESYIRRRDHLLEKIKKEKWEVDDKPQSKKRGRKTKEASKPNVDLEKPRNKYYSWLK